MAEEKVKQEMLHALECVWAGVTDARRKALNDPNSATPDGTLIMTPMLWGTLKKIQATIQKAKEGQ